MGSAQPGWSLVRPTVRSVRLHPVPRTTDSGRTKGLRTDQGQRTKHQVPSATLVSRSVFLSHLADRADAANRGTLAKRLLEDGVRDFGLALHDLRQPINLAVVHVKVLGAGLERHQRLLP